MPRLIKIKAICFDLDGVYFTPEGKKSFHNALITEYAADKQIVDEFMNRGQDMARLVRGKISPGDFWNNFRVVTGINATNQELTKRWVRDYEIDDKVRDIVLKTRAMGYKTCVCTNNNVIRLSALEDRFHFMKDFDCIVSSHEIGYTKPSKEIFLELLRRLDIKPEELVYSDDNPERLNGATELGIITFVFENIDQFLKKLNDLGINLDSWV